jgi:hypothetical protein
MQIISARVCLALAALMVHAAMAAGFKSEAGMETPARITQVGTWTCVQYQDVQVNFNDDDVGALIYFVKGSAVCGPFDHPGTVVATRDETAYFLGKIGDYLIMDEGTGPPPRGLMLFSLSAGKPVLGDSYDPPIDVHGTKIRYWRTLKIQPTPENCPSYEETMKASLEPVIEAFAQIDLAGPHVHVQESNQRRCTSTQ